MNCMSNLPDEIISHILSFLPTKQAALTCVLSKRWRNLFAFSSNLVLQTKKVYFREIEITESFIDFLDRLLSVSSNSLIKKFSLICKRSVKAADINRWICNVLNRGVTDLNLCIDTFTWHELLLELFTCKTLVSLKLSSAFGIAILPDSTCFPALKTLFLDAIRFYEACKFEPLISACPVLEDLTIRSDSNKWPCRRLRISSSTLRRLTIFSTVIPRHCGASLALDTPRLAYLSYSAYVQMEYSIVNLHSLVEAKLSLALKPYPEPNLTNLIQGLRNVAFLTLSTLNTSEIFYSFRESIPVFENLSRLSIVTKLGSCWKLVPLLLKKSPKLDTLIIKGPLHNGDQESGTLCECLLGYSFLLSCPLKFLEITEYNGTRGELEQIKHFLDKSPCLELIKVRVCAKEKSPPDTTDLLTLPRAHKIRIDIFS